MRRSICITFLLLGVTINANSQIIFQSDFDNLSVNTSLNGQNGWTNNSSNGGSGSAVGVASQESRIVGFPLSYPDYGSSSNSLASDTSADSDGPGRLLNTPINSGTFYVGMVINVSNAPPAANVRDVIRIMNGGAFSVSSRLFVQRNGAAGFNVGIKIGDPSTPPGISSSTYSYNQDHLLIFKYTIVAGASNDVMELFIDPVYGNGEPAMADVSAPFSSFEASTNIDRFAFPWNVNNADRFSGHIGLVSLTRTWADLTLSVQNKTRVENTLHYFSTTNELAFTHPASGTIHIYGLDGTLISKKMVNDIDRYSVGPLNAGLYIAQFTDLNEHRLQIKFLSK